MTYDLNYKQEIKVRAAKALGNLANFERVWKNKAISLGMKKKVLMTCIFSSFLYQCETWTITKESEREFLVLKGIATKNYWGLYGLK